MRLSKAQIEQIKEDLRLSPRTFGYTQPQWNGHSLSRHLGSRYQLNYSPRQCRRLISKSKQPDSAMGDSTPLPAEPATKVEPRPWSGFSDTYRQENTLQRLRQLSTSSLPLKFFASSLFELMTSATNSGEAAQALFIGEQLDHHLIFRDLETAEWTSAHSLEHERANCDDTSVSGMLIPARKLPTIIEPTLAPGRFMAPRFPESPSYHELWKHHRIYSGAMGILRSNGGLVGFAPVWKSRKEKPFTQSDLNFLDKAMPIITHGVQLSQSNALHKDLADGTAQTSTSIGVVTTDLKGRVVAINERARTLFFQPALFDGLSLDAFASSNLQAGLRYVSAIVRQIFQNQSAGTGDPLSVPAARVWWHAAGCVLLLRASLSERPSRTPLVTVLVEEHEPLAVKRHRLAIRYGMTPRESEIFRLAKAGTPRKDIATKLGISPNTVKTYLKLAALKIAEMDEQHTTRIR